MSKTIKERLITRTITSTVCNVMYVDLDSMEVKSERMNVSGDFTKISEQEQLEYGRAIVEKGNKRVIMVKAVKLEQKKYAISETDFLKYAHEMTKEEESEETESDGE